jgi:hypothetical protein
MASQFNDGGAFQIPERHRPTFPQASDSSRSGNSTVLERFDAGGRDPRGGANANIARLVIPVESASVAGRPRSHVAFNESVSDIIRRAMGASSQAVAPVLPAFQFNLSDGFDGVNNNNNNLVDVVSEAITSAHAGAPVHRPYRPHIVRSILPRESPEDGAVASRLPSRTIISVSRQMLGAVDVISDAIVQFGNVVSHMPDLSPGDRKSILLFTNMLDRIKVIAKLLPISEDAWKQEWGVFFQSMVGQPSTLLTVADCCVCMEAHPVINVCNNAEHPHLLCSPCLLSHYWVSTEECTRSSATCPLCRTEINLEEIVKRISDTTPRERERVE